MRILNFMLTALLTAKNEWLACLTGSSWWLVHGCQSRGWRALLYKLRIQIHPWFTVNSLVDCRTTTHQQVTHVNLSVPWVSCSARVVNKTLATMYLLSDMLSMSPSTLRLLLRSFETPSTLPRSYLARNTWIGLIM